MTKTEKQQVAALLGEVSDLVYSMGRRWDKNAPDWYKRLYWQEFEPQRVGLQRRIKELTGEYIPIG